MTVRTINHSSFYQSWYRCRSRCLRSICRVLKLVCQPQSRNFILDPSLPSELVLCRNAANPRTRSIRLCCERFWWATDLSNGGLRIWNRISIFVIWRRPRLGCAFPRMGDQFERLLFPSRGVLPEVFPWRDRCRFQLGLKSTGFGSPVRPASKCGCDLCR